jgi:hypothetical protein
MTWKPSLVAQALVDLFESNKSSLGLTDVWFGDQALIPRTPAVAVELPTVSRELTDTGMMTTNRFETALFVYHSELQDINKTRKEASELAEDCVDLLDTKFDLDGTLIHGHVESIEPGYAQRSNAMYQAVRLNYVGLTKTRLGG